MKMNLYQRLSLALLLALMVSCNKSWLDVKSDKSQTVAADYSDFQELLDQTTQMNYWAPIIGEVGSDGHYITNESWSTISYDNGINAYTWTHNDPYTHVTDWTTSYPIAFTADLVLEGIAKLKPATNSDQLQWNNIRGQALFHRANLFFELAQIWAPPYDSGSAGKDLSIPLRLSSDITAKSIHSTVQQTYNQIISDLQEAKTLLPQKAAYLTRPSLPATLALLARVYLAVGNYDSAFAYSDKCLQLYSDLLDYNTLDTTASSVGLFNKEVLFHNVMYTGPYYQFMDVGCLIDTALYDLYDGNDLRRAVFFLVNADSSITYKGNYNDRSDAELFCGMATDEVYLIRAECNARKGNVSNAMNDLNILLQSRWRTGTFVPFTAFDSDDALAQILIERRKELLMRGLRWTDLRRLNKDDRFAVTLSRNIGGTTYTIAPNSFRYTLPIPDDIIQITGMQQNPGW